MEKILGIFNTNTNYLYFKTKNSAKDWMMTSNFDILAWGLSDVFWIIIEIGDLEFISFTLIFTML